MTPREELDLEIARIREDNRRRDMAREEEGNRIRDEERDRLAREERRREELEDYRREMERERLDALEADLAGCRYAEAGRDALEDIRK
jgi:hypothetical protein